MPSRKTKFTGVSIRLDLWNDIKAFIKDHPEAGYKSPTDFAQEAIRTRIQHVKTVYPSEQQDESQ